MFSFLFEGKIGEMLAPVMPANQLYLAIQNHRQAEVQSLVASQQFDLRKAGDAGYMAIHVACRFNNVPALDLIVQQGIPIDFPDLNGNTTLHYAAKAGHLDLCKILVDRGCSPARRNNHNQTPYDATDNHLVRQYLLPLIFKYENNQGSSSNTVPQDSSAYGMNMQTQQSQIDYEAPSYQTNMENFSTNQTYNPPPPAFAPPSYPPVYSPPVNLAEVPLDNPPMNTYAAPTPVISYPPAQSQPPVYTLPPMGVTSSVPISNTSNGMRKIKADGFHSSASDPELKAKYGHIKPEINIAPPPTGGPMGSAPTNQYSAYSNMSGVAAPVYNRYPVYDPITNSAVPLQMPAPAFTAPTQTTTFVPLGMQQQQQQQPVQPSTASTSPYRSFSQRSVTEEEIVADASSSSVL